MLADVRRTEIVAIVARERVARVADLAELLGVSVVTVRRDIEALDDAGLVQKIHGGAKLPGDAGTHEPGFELKSTQSTQEKKAIAQAAVQLVHDGMAIGLSAGTTTWALAKALSSRKNLTVVTNSVKIADVFQGAGSRVSVILTGGERTPSDALVGPIATQSVRSLHLDILFLGVHGVDEVAGFTTPNLLEAEMDRALIEAARRVVVLADHSKWGTVGISTIAAMEDVDEVISDDALGLEAQRILREHVGKLRLVGIATHSPESLAAQS
ncbi:DeoR family glycerol-3-phosphate regulon repressor [Arthrobacter silviterrae]|uniref:DeoR/GlpR transcriptional regulator n=1 Tax=Arthrobacter silviterrae TaxID=2026658 RepID=A0ABX0DCV7_9MICC|nr:MULTISPECIES: DeoR/GlpR family DNA-binding transcription regulator [Arthrobacter]MCU6478937.1 DeoR/GlpR family DNA-binding transcription regulator [Arthrobacter sp. A2-55]MDQ0277927.1 DeoR family glycerol-3-phosphate regulon repressor [Arthrobacter silviterrae]NGN84763.1 DeoR/GlpR transcriptional regulator [Arthrobacter silviterrae]